MAESSEHSRLTSGGDEQQNAEDAEHRGGRHLGWGSADADVGGDRADHPNNPQGLYRSEGSVVVVHVVNSVGGAW